ncbi:MAG: tetratricopeptide repeat protein [Candidatus Dormibacteria bacterium]|jgi:tetratricopeptide (TPR) repeat protein
MSLISPSGGGSSASGNDAASPRVTRAEEPPAPPLLLAALRLLAAGAAAAASSFDRVLAAEASPTWRALALLGRGLCEELNGAPAAAQLTVTAALEEWRAADPGACAMALAALGRALSTGSDADLGGAFLGAAQQLSGAGPPEVLGAVLLELGSAAAENGEARTAAARWQEALERGDPRARAAAAANLGRLAAARGDAAAAGSMFERAMTVAGGPHVRVVADGLVTLAAQAAAEGRWDEVDSRLRQALPLRRADADDRGVAEVLHDLGIAYWRLDQLQRATRSLEECRARAEELGDEALRGAALRALAAVALQDGRLVVALAYAQEATLVASTSGDRHAVAGVLRQVGEEARRQGSDSLSGEAFRAAAGILAGGD